MQTSVWTKFFISILLVLFGVGFQINHPDTEIDIYINTLKNIVFLLMLNSLRMSLIGFYQGTNLYVNHLRFNKVLDKDYYDLCKWNIKLGLYSQISFFDKKYQAYCNTDGDMSSYLNSMVVRNEQYDDFNKRKLFLAFYSMNLCIEMATWTLIFTIIPWVVKILEYSIYVI